MDADDQHRLAIDAALAAGATAGYPAARPVVLQETNNVVVWLSPHPIVAKVGVWAHSRALLQMESELCAELVAVGAPVVAPIRDSPIRSEHGFRPGAGRYGEGQLPVSLWRQVDTRGAPPTAAEVAALLRRVHADLRTVDAARLHEPLPSFLAAVELAQEALRSGEWLGWLPPGDLAMLRDAGERWAALAAELPVASFRPLHGEPHPGNVLSTSHGLVMIDFEGACTGPVEWDLASVAPAVVAEYARLASADGPPVDPARLTLLRALNSVRVATWCCASRHDSMREHGVVHLEAVRSAIATGL